MRVAGEKMNSPTNAQHCLCEPPCSAFRILRTVLRIITRIPKPAHAQAASRCGRSCSPDPDSLRKHAAAASGREEQRVSWILFEHSPLLRTTPTHGRGMRAQSPRSRRRVRG